jgi:hypothetical protein
MIRWLTANVPPWGGTKRSKGWTNAYVWRLLSSPSLKGVYQPMVTGTDGKKVPDGDAVLGYYPVVIDPEVWQRVQDVLELRRTRKGPTGKKVASLFSGFLWDARTQGRMYITHQTRKKKGKTYCRRILTSKAAMNGTAGIISFPNDVFEAAVLGLLREVQPGQILDEPEGEAAMLAEQLAAKELRRRQIVDLLVNSDDDAASLGESVKKLDGQIKDLKTRLAEAQQRERHPRTALWAEAATLLDCAHDEKTRVRLRDLLQRMIERVDVLIVPRKVHRLCLVQLAFAGDGTRTYVIHYWGAGFGRTGGWEAHRYSGDKEKDLRRPADVKALQRILEEVDLEKEESA